MKMEDDVPKGRLVGAGAHADGAMPDMAETGTVLDYLWEGQQGSAFEPVEADSAAQIAAEYNAAGLGMASNDAGKNAHEPVPIDLDSTLNRYNVWLASLQSSMTDEGHESLE